MKRSTFRAWKCRLGVHRYGWPQSRQFVGPACKDCGDGILVDLTKATDGKWFVVTGGHGYIYWDGRTVS